MDFNHIEGPSPYNGDNYVGKAQPKSSEQPNLLPKSLATPPTNSEAHVHFSSRTAPVDDAFLHELDQVLDTKATQIEKELKGLEGSKKIQELINAALETGNWGIWGHQFCDTTRKSVKEGLEFLENVLPHHLLSQLPHHNQLDRLGGLLSLSGVFLTALDSSSQGLALVCRTKILQRSRELLQYFKSIYQENPSLSTSIMAPAQESVDHLPSSLENLKSIYKILEGWEVNLDLEEEILVKEKRLFAVNTASNILYILNTPLVYLPKEVIVEHIKIAAELGCSWIMSGLEIVTTGFEFIHAKKNAQIFNQWANAYKQWQDEHLPKGKISGEKVQEEQLPPHTPPSFPSAKEHEAALFKFFDEAQDLSQIRSYLKKFNIDLNPALKFKEEFLHQLETNTAERAQLITAYIQAGTLEALDVIIKTSSNLLDKREAIAKKKMLLLKPQYHTVEAKAQELKKNAFIRDIQNILWGEMQSPQCSAKAIKEQFQKWGFYEAPTEKSRKVIQALEQFEKVPFKTSFFKRKLIQEFYKWMDHPTAMDEQFQAWVQTQSKEQMLQTYIDHQETIEHTTKNALKQMVQQKHEIENRFIKFKQTKAAVHFSVATISLTISVGLTILGLLTVPFGGAGLILLMISLGSTVISLGLLGASYYQAYREKPNSTLTLSIRFQAKMTWTRLRAAIQAYQHQAKEKKLLEIAKVLHRLQMSTSLDKEHEAEYQQAFLDYEKAKLQFEESEKKTKEWLKKLKKLETHLAKQSWQDFAKQAALQIGRDSAAFDTLQAFQQALEACDLRLLSEETKTLLSVQLGLDLEALQAQMNKDPKAIKKTLRDFFALNDAELVSFIRKMHLKQRVHLKSEQAFNNTVSFFKKFFKTHTTSPKTVF